MNYDYYDEDKLAMADYLRDEKKEQQGYYLDELRKIDTKTEYAPTVQIRNGNLGATKWINLNEDSAEVLVKWLKNEFNLK